MNRVVRQQILISGVGGQGVLFVTRLLAEAAIARGLSVFTSETHGMAQRGGTVISHLKVGEFHSPLIRAGQADGLLALKAENLPQHMAFLKPSGWAVVNSAANALPGIPATAFLFDADDLARKLGNVKSVNLIMLGFTLAVAAKAGRGSKRLFCTLAQIKGAIGKSLITQKNRSEVFLEAIQAGYDAGG